MSMYLLGAKRIFTLFLPATILFSCQNEVTQTSDKPRHDLSPMEVIVSQLVALQTNDQPDADHGIAVAFAFASPKNKTNTGPFTKFKAMLQSNPYRPLIDHKQHKISKHFIEGEKAQFFVEIVSNENKTLHYIFSLSLVKKEPYNGFWMTDAVMPIRGKINNPHKEPVQV